MEKDRGGIWFQKLWPLGNSEEWSGRGGWEFKPSLQLISKQGQDLCEEHSRDVCNAQQKQNLNWGVFKSYLMVFLPPPGFLIPGSVTALSPSPPLSPGISLLITSQDKQF